MKIHSYCAVNGYLSHQNIVYARTLKKLQDRCREDPIGGWDNAVALAARRREEKIAALRAMEFAEWTYSTSDTAGNSGTGTPSLAPTVAAPQLSGLHQRLISVKNMNMANTSSIPLHLPIENELDENRHVLTHHPDLKVSELAITLTEVEAELTPPAGNGNKTSLRWPQNITLWNFIDYQLIPTLVYEMQYPRTERFVDFEMNPDMKLI